MIAGVGQTEKKANGKNPDVVGKVDAIRSLLTNV
jgi:hypothetical protein